METLTEPRQSFVVKTAKRFSDKETEAGVALNSQRYIPSRLHWCELNQPQPEQPCSPVTHTAAFSPLGSAAPRPAGKKMPDALSCTTPLRLSQVPPPHGRATTHTYALINHGKTKHAEDMQTCTSHAEVNALMCVMKSRSVLLLPCKAAIKRHRPGSQTLTNPPRQFARLCKWIVAIAPKHSLGFAVVDIYMYSAYIWLISNNKQKPDSDLHPISQKHSRFDYSSATCRSK